MGPKTEVLTKTCRRCEQPFECPRARGQANKLYCSARCRYPAARLDGSQPSRAGLAARANKPKREAVREATGAGAQAFADATVYSDDEAEFLRRVAEYRNKTGRTFPTCTELFRLLLGMGYRRSPG